MKKIMILLLTASLWSCSSPQEPEFLRLEQIKATNISTTKINFTGEAVFYNPNAIGGSLTSTDILVTTNGIEVATISQDKTTSIPANAEFSVPVHFNTSPEKIFGDDTKSILSGVINALLKKSVDLQFKGKVHFKIGGIPFKTDIDIEEEVKL